MPFPSTIDHDVVTGHPLGGSLDHLLKSLQDLERSYSVISSLDGTDDRTEEYRGTVSRLLLALLGTKAALNLRSKNRDLAAELAALIPHVHHGDFNYTYYRPLVNLILQTAPDLEIWSAVLNLINKLSRETPPATVSPAFDSTPITHSSASQQVEARIFEEIKGCTYRDVKGFFEKYFEEKEWTNRAQNLFASMKPQHIDGRWSTLPNSPTQTEMQNFVFALQDNFLPQEQRRYYTINLPSELTGGEARRQVDLIIKRKREAPSDLEHNWRDIEVIGELKASNNDGVKKTLVQLARYARDVFACQPIRRYLHAFTICGRVMETWVFDRSGCYSPGTFDIHKEPERFIQVIAGYVMMNDEELGLDTFTKEVVGSRTIHIQQEGAQTISSLGLQLEPLIRQRAIVCRGTSCFLTKSPDKDETLEPNDWSHVTKFSWTSDRRKPEADLLRLANTNDVQGIAKLVGHLPITSIKEMRSGIIFPEPYSFRSSSSPMPLFSQSQTASKSSSNLQGSSITKPERNGIRPLLRKRKSTDAATKLSSKRSRSSLSQRNEVSYDVQDAQGTSLPAPSSSSPYDNRIFRCLVIFPAGRPIYKYESHLELVEGLRDAIKAHRSLYSEGKILHRDISENNIIITDSKKTGSSGMLIDLDLAKELGSGRSGARCRTGTMEFMAIEVLRDIDHTYRHDLESFFYVLLWQCGHRGWEFVRNLKGRPVPSNFTDWYTGNYQQIAGSKRGRMYIDAFEDILDEFPPYFECLMPLCRDLRGMLFPYRNGLFLGTPKDPDVLYGPVIKAFNKAIDSIKGT